MEEPKWDHYCKSCYFLGNFYDKEEGGIADLYYCKNGPTVIARYSSEPADYMSGLYSSRLPALKEAVKRAMKEKLIPQSIIDKFGFDKI